MEEVKQWLKGEQDFNKGCLLYSKYGRKGSVALLKKNGNNPMTRQALERMMKALVESTKDTAPVENTPATPDEKKTMVPVGKSVELDPIAARLQSEGNKLYAEMGMLQARLSAIPDKEERAKVVRKLLQLQGQWAAKMSELDTYITTGALPEEGKEKVSPKNLAGNEHAELILLRSKISRAERQQIPSYKNTLAKEPRNKKIAAKLATREKELAEWKAKVAELEQAA